MSYKLNYFGVKLLSEIRNFRPEDNFYVFSDPRGGSTWLSDLIRTIPRTSTLWEPLHTHYSEEFRRLNFSIRQFIPEGKDWPEARKLFERLFRGKVWNVFSSQRTTPLEHLKADQLIVKICRGNRLLPWLVNNFEFRYEPIYMVRNPYAVIASQLQQGAWDIMISSFPMPERLHQDEFCDKHKAFLTSLRSKESVLAAIWCSSNLHLMEHPQNNKRWIFLTYEDLFIDPERSIDLIFARWGLKVPRNIYDIVNVPSFTSKDKTTTGTNTQQLEKWKTYLKSEQIKDISRVLSYFNEKHYSVNLVC